MIFSSWSPYANPPMPSQGWHSPKWNGSKSHLRFLLHCLGLKSYALPSLGATPDSLGSPSLVHDILIVSLKHSSGGVDYEYVWSPHPSGSWTYSAFQGCHCLINFWVSTSTHRWCGPNCQWSTTRGPTWYSIVKFSLPTNFPPCFKKSGLTGNKALGIP